MQRATPDDASIEALFAGRFRIERLLGRGAMGDVHLAHHLMMDRPVALKLLRAELLEDERYRRLFRREARAASRIDHPNVTRVYDFDELPDGRAYLVMEYVPGPTLAAALKKTADAGQPMELGRAFHILGQVADALAAAHDAGVVHRDLKPANIALTTRGATEDVVKVLDFGLAKIVGGATMVSLTEDEAIGTPSYMSPEQCDPEGAIDHRADLYSFGVLCYRLLCDALPFTSNNPVKVMVAHRTAAPPTPSSISRRGSLPPALDRLLLRCLAKDPDDRYQSAAELAGDLRRAATTAVRPARTTLPYGSGV